VTFANLKSRLQGWARSLKRQIMILWFCARNPETPWLARVLVVCVVAYALSPIDLIPDFIPVLGYLDDAILLPLRLLPPPVLAAGRQQAEEWERRQVPRPVNWPAAGLILLLWALGIVLVGRWLMA